MDRRNILKLLSLLIVLHLFSVNTGKNINRISICPNYSFCSCYPDTRNRVEIYCFGTKSVHPIYELLLKEFNDTVIKRLSFSVDCYLTSLPSYLFDNCTVQRISSSCPLSDIDHHAFIGMKGLTRIDLQNTIFSEIPEGLMNLQYVETLMITNHSLVSLGNRHWNISSLKYLSVTHGYLQELSNDTFTGIPNLEHLDLENNQLISVHPKVLSTLKLLKWIALGYNSLTNAEDIFKGNNPTVIELQCNNLTSMKNVIHEGMNRLETLNVSRNVIREIDSSTFGTLKKLKNFFMTHAECTRINISFPLQFPRLKKLNLSFNKLHNLPGNTFSYHKNLGTIELQYNSITCNHYLFSSIPRLYTLNLDHNNISALSDCFGRLLVLQTLQLSRNSIRRIEDSDFQGLLQIRTLTLAHNSIEFIGSKSLTSLRYLKTLDLSHNRIHQLNGSLRYVTTLSDLRINSCYLQTLTASDFYKVRNITALDLSNNNLTSIDGAFQNFAELSILNLANNKLRTISRRTFPEKLKLKELRLEQGNEWNCDCRLLWLLDWLSDSKYTVLKDKPSCSLPRNQLRKIFQEVRTNEILESQEECPSPCHCACSPNDSHPHLLIDCSGKNLTRVPPVLPRSTGILNLSENELTAVNISGDVQGLFSLNLEHNRITSLEIGFLPQLKELKLSNNMLLRPPMTPLLENPLQAVTLSSNPWICDCDTGAFRNWLQKNQGKVKDLNEVKCATSGSHKYLTGEVIYLLEDSDLCPTPLYIGLVAGLTGFVLVSLFVLCLTYRHHLISFLYARGLTCIKEEDTDTESAFDGFLSYSWLDEQFAFAKIVSGLQDMEPNFTLSIPNRDVYGMHSNLLISQDMKRSKRILILINENYINDENSMTEFRIACNLCLEHKTKRLIFIKNGKFPRSKDLDPYIKRAMKSSVCVSWGEKFFWERLRYAMPKKINDINLRNTVRLEEHPTWNDDEDSGGNGSIMDN